MARFYADENFPYPTVERLRELGHDAVTVLERGYAGLGISDPIVLARAIDEQRAVLTQNRRDFIPLHIANPIHFGIVACTEDLDFASLAQRIHETVISLDELNNQLIRVNRPNIQ